MDFVPTMARAIITEGRDHGTDFKVVFIQNRQQGADFNLHIGQRVTSKWSERPSSYNKAAPPSVVLEGTLWSG